MKVRLGDICTVVSGSTPKTNNPAFWDGDINWITPAELDDTTIIINESQRKITEEGVRSCGLTEMPAGTVILSSRAPIGKTAIAGVPMYCNQGFKNLICSDRIYNRYLYWFLRENTEYLQSLGRGATFKEISKKIVEEIEIPLPPLNLQKEIANSLDRINDLIALHTRQLTKLDELVKARFVEMFNAKNAGCCKKRIGDYAHVLGGYAFKSDDYIPKAIPVIRISNIQEGKINPDYMVCYDENFWNQNPKFRALSGDILMAMSGATTGKAGIIRRNERLLINQRVACIRVKARKAFSEFIYAATQLPWMYDLIQEKAAGCAQPNISGKQIENMPIPEATFIQQKQYTDFVLQVDKSKESVQRGLDKLETLKKALMQEYFG